jgi:hypothetical protein
MNTNIDKEKIKELEEKFEFLAQEISQNYLKNTQLKHRDIDFKMNTLLNEVTKRVFTICEERMNNMMEMSEKETNVDMNDKVTLTLKPKVGKEKDFSALAQEFLKCATPIVSLYEQVMNFKSTFNTMNNYSYSLCLTDCKNNLLKSNQEGHFKFEELKYCLKDCYNLGTFNFNTYYENLNNGLNINLDKLNKL